MVAIRGHFDGKVFVPDEPVDLPRNQSVVLHVEPTGEIRQQATEPAGDFFQVLTSLTGTVEAPADWSAEHDHYLYGTPRHGKKAAG